MSLVQNAEFAADAKAGAVRVQLSVVVSCFNEEESLPVFHARVSRVLRDLVGDGYEIIYVDDGSTDRTWRILRGFAETDSKILCLSLSRNFGKEMGMTAGFEVARGDLIFGLDADLQDPPELLPDMMALIDAGADVVYGQRTDRPAETQFKLVTAALFYRLLRRIAYVRIPATADFRLMKRSVVNALNGMPEQHRFIRGMVAWLGFKQVAFPYQAQPRVAGKTKFPLRKLMVLALDAITGFSIVPLRFALAAGVIVCALTWLIGLYVLASWLLGYAVPGWASSMMTVALLGGVQLLCIGLISEYIGRIYLEVKRRPHFVVREVYSRQQTL